MLWIMGFRSMTTKRLERTMAMMWRSIVLVNMCVDGRADERGITPRGKRDGVGSFADGVGLATKGGKSVVSCG